jgi:hypothetical protein
VLGITVHACHVGINAAELLGGIGVKPITIAIIQIDVSSCQPPVGWFDQLNPQWNVIQCVQDKVKLVHLITLLITAL